MALWLKRGRYWQRAHALRPYFPPPYLRLYPAETGPHWRASGALEEYAADELPEFVAALINSCRRPQSGFQRRIWQLKGDRVVPSQGIVPFPPEGVIRPGLELTRLDKPPDQWLVTLHLARSTRGLLAAQVERYVGSWHAMLSELLRACQAGPH